MLNIYYARESTDKEKFIFENITPGSFVIVPDQYTLEGIQAYESQGTS